MTDRFGRMAHGRGFIWDKALPVLLNLQDVLGRMLTINRNMAAGLIKRWMPHLFISSERIWRAKTQVLKEKCS